jgi:hypothetical protein
MKSKSAIDNQRFVARALERLTSPVGRKELRAATERSRIASEPFRRAREISPSKLHRRFTV